MNLRINRGDLHFLEIAAASDDEEYRYKVDGVTDVIDPNQPLLIDLQDKTSVVLSPSQLCVQTDEHGNLFVHILLSCGIRMILGGIIPIDDTLINVLEDTQLHDLVKNRAGWWAISEYQVLCA
jgi:hypothetical protein